MSGVLVVGFGSPHGDDQVGWMAVQLAAKNFESDLAVQFITAARGHSEWLGRLSDCQFLVLIDAVFSPALTLGEIVEMSVIRSRLFETAHYSSVTSHGFGVYSALMLADSLDLLPDCVPLIGVSIKSAQPMTVMSEPVSRAISKASERILATIERQRSDLFV